jgi:hypothetical protein
MKKVLFLLLICIPIYGQNKLVTIQGNATYDGIYLNQGNRNGYPYYKHTTQNYYLFVDNYLGLGFQLWLLGNSVTSNPDNSIVDYYQFPLSANPGDAQWYTETPSSNATITITDTALPVELVLFTAMIDNNAIKLIWRTVTEVNNYGFEIERASTLEHLKWEKIGFVKGEGNANSPKNYKFIDNQINSLTREYLQYRLKEIDTDGSYKYSDEIKIKLSEPKEFSLTQNYPNPFNPLTNIKFEIPQNSFVRISVYNLLGQEIEMLVDEEKAAGSYEINFSANDLPNGIYIYKMQAGSFIQTRKMILLK